MKRTFMYVFIISFAFVLSVTLCGCGEKTSEGSSLSSDKPVSITNNDQANNPNESDITSTSKSTATTPKVSNTAKAISAYKELLNIKVGTKVTFEGVSIESAFDRAWAGTHYRFTMTFGDTNHDEVYVDMTTDKKLQNIVRGTRISVTGEMTGLRGASGGREIPEIQLDSYEVLS